MLSAYKVEPLEKVQGLEFGATGYLEKTISLRELEGWVAAQMKSFGLGRRSKRRPKRGCVREVEKLRIMARRPAEVKEILNLSIKRGKRAGRKAG
jgi:DNA-binding response OmpR family regulator